MGTFYCKFVLFATYVVYLVCHITGERPASADSLGPAPLGIYKEIAALSH